MKSKSLWIPFPPVLALFPAPTQAFNCRLVLHTYCVLEQGAILQSPSSPTAGQALLPFILSH